MASKFPPAFLDELRDRADIVQVVSRRVQLTQKGGRYWGLCPFHGEKTPSFSVNPQKQMYYCFGCHASGSAITFVMEMEHLEFREAVVQLAGELHMDVPQLVDSGREQISRTEKERLYEANRACAKFFHAQLWLPQNEHILAYLHNRGIDDHTIRVFGLGSTPVSGEGATRALMEQGFTREELVKAGISVFRDGRTYDMFRSRAIFPIIDAHGRVLGFGGRTLGDAKPKYLNTGDTPVFNKRLGVFAANLLAKQRNMKRIILTEGYMDVIALVQAGLTGVCATLGTALTIEQARLLKRWAPEIWVSYDGDAAGQHAILRALDIFEQEQVPVRVLDFPDGMDPDEYIRKYGSASVETLSPVDGVTYRMLREAEKHDLSTQDGRTAYAKACAVWLARVREPVELENYIQRLMMETGFAREVLVAQIGRTEMLETREENRPRPARPEPVSRDRDAAAEAPEEELLRILAEHPKTAELISPADFITDKNRILAEKLMAGKKPGTILEEIEDEAERARVAGILQKESAADEQTDILMIGDCLVKLRQKRIDNEISALRAQLSSLGGSEKRTALERIQTLYQQRREIGTRKDG